MRKLLLFIILGLQVVVSAQHLDHRDHNYGKIKEWNNPVAQFKYTNTSNKEQLFLPIAYQQHIGVRVEKERLRPGESTFIHVLYYTEEFGRFDETVQVYVNTQQEPISMRVRGRIVSLHPDAWTRCPTVDVRDDMTRESFDHKIIVLDDKTGETLTEYDLEWNSSRVQEQLFVSGTFHKFKKVQADLYHLVVEKERYNVHEELVYVNRTKTVTIVRLVPEVYESWDEPIDELPEESPDIPEQVKTDEPENNDDTVVILEEFPEIEEPQQVVDTALVTDEGSLNSDLLRANHIVFIIDVSSSMNKPEKLPLLKYSMSELIKVLRSEDKVTIITYSNSVNVLAKGIAGSDKETLLNIILSLEAKGQSYGSEALVEAYDLAKDLFIEDGNNELILASDGLFNSVNFKKNREYRRAWYQQRFNEIRISCIAFGRSPYALDFMRQLAKRGDGAFIQIADENYAKTSLINNLILHSSK